MFGVLDQPGAYRSGSLGFTEPTAYRSGVFGNVAQPGSYNSGSLGCGCAPKPMQGFGSVVRSGMLSPLKAMQGLGRAALRGVGLGGLSLDLDTIVGAGVGGGVVWMLLKNKCGGK